MKPFNTTERKTKCNFYDQTLGKNKPTTLTPTEMKWTGGTVLPMGTCCVG